MGNRSPIQISLHKAPVDLINEEEAFFEEYAQYYLSAYYSIAQLACFRLNTPQDSDAKICGKISPTGNTSLRFLLRPSPDGHSLELIPHTSSIVDASIPQKAESAQGFEKALFAFFDAVIPKTIAQQPSILECLQISENFQQDLQRLAIEMMHQMGEQQRRWIRDNAERRDCERQVEKREREKDQIRKEEEKRQELRVVIQKREEPKRQSQRLSIQKEQANVAQARSKLHHI